MEFSHKLNIHPLKYSKNPIFVAAKKKLAIYKFNRLIITANQNVATPTRVLELVDRHG